MMRIGVFSDSHGDSHALDELLEKMGHVDVVCFLGDVARDADHLRERCAAMPGQPELYAVRGNNDYYSTCQLPWELLIELDGVRIYMTHGHRAAGYMGLVYKAQELEARVAMFGCSIPVLQEITAAGAGQGQAFWRLTGVSCA